MDYWKIADVQNNLLDFKNVFSGLLLTFVPRKTQIYYLYIFSLAEEVKNELQIY